MLFFRWPIVRGYMNVCNCMEGMVYIAVSKSDLFLFRVDVCSWSLAPYQQFCSLF